MPATFSWGASTSKDEQQQDVATVFTVKFPELRGFVVPDRNYSAAYSTDKYFSCDRWPVEVGAIVHVRCNRNKDLDDRIVLIVEQPGPEKFLRGYSFCKHEPAQPNDRHWNVVQREMEGRRSLVEPRLPDTERTLDAHLANGWRLERDLTINLALPFIINSGMEAGTTVHVVGFANEPSVSGFKRAVALHLFKSLTDTTPIQAQPRVRTSGGQDDQGHHFPTSRPRRGSFSSASTLEEQPPPISTEQPSRPASAKAHGDTRQQPTQAGNIRGTNRHVGRGKGERRHKPGSGKGAKQRQRPPSCIIL